MANLVKRADKLAFYGVKSEDDVVYYRMTGFTEMSVSKNPKEYSRQYVDEEFEQSDIVGYSPSISYGFDQYTENPVHADIAAISDNELLGTDAVRDIVWVDLTTDSAGSCQAIMRSFAVIPDSEGNGTDAYQYSGNFKVKGEKIAGTASSADDWQTLTFTPDGQTD